LKRAGKATAHRILKSQQLRPERVQYYLERRDPQFEQKRREVPVVYAEVAGQPGQAGNACALTVTLAVDEKPGVQAIANTAPDLPPAPGQRPCISRDHEYKRHGACSILAGIDLLGGHVFAKVERRHRSRECIGLLHEIAAAYPPGITLRLILGNHSAHLSKETRAWLATRPNRFQFVHTPTHGSWLNRIETLFGKMARSFLKHIRGASWDELRQRILQGIAEINAAPVVHRWQKTSPINNV
jgi:transposase